MNIRSIFHCIALVTSCCIVDYKFVYLRCFCMICDVEATESSGILLHGDNITDFMALRTKNSYR